VTAAGGTLSGILVATLVAQAVLPGRRLLLVSGGAAVAALVASVTGVADTPSLLASVPWPVIVMLAALGLLAEALAETRVVGLLALAAARRSRAEPMRIALLFGGGMYVVSGLVNNLTALLLVLPVLHNLCKIMGIGQRALSWTTASLLVACNLGGAATPIGDFPAILLLGSGAMTFSDYLVAALPPTLVALVIVLGTAAAALRSRGEDATGPATSGRLSLAIMGALHRRVRPDLQLLRPLGLALAGMLLAWALVPSTTGVSPELIAWVGVTAALTARPALGERLIRRRIDVEAALFLLSLFVMVEAVEAAGVFASLAEALARAPLPPAALLVLFLVIAGVLTGLFSAGPSMAALLTVAPTLCERLPPRAVYVGLALSVCAGSSLFLTAATSGPLAQAMTERALLRGPQGEPLRYGFLEHLPVGLLAFAVIQSVAIGWALIEVARSGG